jgi:ABC-type phosphate transport system, permease component
MIRFNLKHNMMGFSLRKILNYIFISLCFIAFTLAMIPLIWILAETIIRGISALSIELLLNTAKPPGTPGGGIANYIQGTIILVAIASLIGFPFGLLLGIFLSEYKEHKLAPYIRFFVEVFAEFPAIVIGIFIYVTIVRGDIFRLFGVEKICISSFCLGPTGFATIAGAISLALLMIPIVAKAVEESLKLVPTSIKEAALSLGMSKVRSIFPYLSVMQDLESYWHIYWLYLE